MWSRNMTPLTFHVPDISRDIVHNYFCALVFLRDICSICEFNSFTTYHIEIEKILVKITQVLKNKN
jgi:hypothetical protein